MATHTHQRSATSWAQLVHRLLPGDGPEQSRARNAMESVDRRHFVEPGTPETVVYRVSNRALYQALGMETPWIISHMCGSTPLHI